MQGRWERRRHACDDGEASTRHTTPCKHPGVAESKSAARVFAGNSESRHAALVDEAVAAAADGSHAGGQLR
jgi:hypothetical protein